MRKIWASILRWLDAPEPSAYPLPYDRGIDVVLPCALCGWREEIHAPPFADHYPAAADHAFVSPCENKQ